MISVVLVSGPILRRYWTHVRYAQAVVIFWFSLACCMYLVEVCLPHGKLCRLGNDQAPLFGSAELVRPRVLTRELPDVDVPFQLFLPLFVRACPQFGSKQPKVAVISGRQENRLPLLLLLRLLLLLPLSSFCFFSIFSCCSLFTLCTLPSRFRGCACLLQQTCRGVRAHHV